MAGVETRAGAEDPAADAGMQGAYGIMCDVESHPFELDTMLFMDWRDDHTEGHPEMRDANRCCPLLLHLLPPLSLGAARRFVSTPGACASLPDTGMQGSSGGTFEGGQPLF